MPFYYSNRTSGKIGNEVATATGEFSYRFTIPDSTAGGHEIIAEDTAGNSAEAEFEVVPSVALDLTSGAVGDILTVSGNGFGYRSDVAIYFGDIEVAYAKTDGYGNFEVAFNIPPMATDTYDVRAEDGDENTGKAEFTVTVGASLNLTTGNVGTDLTVSGTGFVANRAVTIKYDDVVIATATTDADGAFDATFKVPASKSGEHVTIVSDGISTRWLAFNVESDAPPVPVLLLPISNSEAKAAAYFDWGDVDDPSLPISYSLQVASDRSFTSIVLEKNGLTHSEYSLTGGEKLAAVKKEAPYCWRVKAMDSAANESEWSTPETFHVAAPPAPVLLLPEADIKAEAEVYFDWEDVVSLSPPVVYNLQVASDKRFTSIVLEKKWLTGSEYLLTEEEKLDAVKKEAPYYWRVKATDGAFNEGEWSAPGSFYVGFSTPGWIIYTLIGLGALLAAFLAFWLGRRTAYYQSYVE